MSYGTGYKKDDFKRGDMILYPYVEDEILRGRIIDCNDKEAKIEVSFPGKKSEDLNVETIIVNYNEIIPMSKGIKSFQTKAQKKAAKESKNKK